VGGVLAVALPMFAGCAGSSLVEDPPPERNLVVLTQLSGRIADREVAQPQGIDSAAVLLTVTPRDHWFLFDAFAAALERRRCRIVTSPSARASVEVTATQVVTAYENPRRLWMLGGRVMDRVISVECRVRWDSAGTVSAIRTLSAAQRDTIWVDDAARLESMDLPATKGTMPDAGVFDDLIEPLVLAGAVAVAIVLLFSVRS